MPIVLLLVFSVGLTLGCTRSESPPTISRADLTTEEIASVEAFESTLHPLLTRHCAACHGARQVPYHSSKDSVEAHQVILQANLVNLDQPKSSRFISKLKEGHRHFPPTMAEEFENQIRLWAKNLESKEPL